MPKHLWKGAIAFSLIHIPVTLQAASRSQALELDLLDRRDFSPVGYQRINKSTGKAVEWADIVKGYKHDDDEYVVLTEEDFRLANVEATQTIDIQCFVRPDEVGTEFFETPYHVLPDTRGEKVFALFRDALARSKAMAIGLIVIRTRQHICAILPRESTLLLNTLRFADEIIAADPDQSRTAKQKAVSAGEMTMALKLVEDMREAWKPTAFHDSYRMDLLKRVEQKALAGETKLLTTSSGKGGAARASNVVDLTKLLKKSLEARRPRTSKAEKPRARKKTATRSR